MSRRTVSPSSRSLVRRPESALWSALGVINQLQEAVSNLMSLLCYDGVVSLLAPGLSIDSNAENIETDNAIVIRHKGQLYAVAAVTAADLSAIATAAGDSITQDKIGTYWVYSNTAGTLDGESAFGDEAAITTAIQAEAQFSVATNTLPPGTDDVIIGGITVAPTSGAHVFGTTALTTVGTFFDIIRKPSVEVAAASFARVSATAATYVYGAVTFVLGSGVRVVATGKTGCTLAGTNIANGYTGVWLVYGKADDVEYALQLGYAYATYQAAVDAIRAHKPNPYLALIGTIIVENASGAVFIPGTTALGKGGITATFNKNGPGSDFIETGRAALGQPFTAPDDITVAGLGFPS